MDAVRPFSKKQVLNLVKKPAIFSDEEISKDITERKVDFEVSAEVEQELVEGGASAGIVSVCRTSYVPPKKAAPPPPPAPAPSGGPLSKDGILSMLRKKTTASRIEKTVEARGVDFTLDAATTNELKKAGGTNALIGAIASRYVPPIVKTDSNADRREPPASGSTYSDLIYQALISFRTRDIVQVTLILQKAIALDPGKPQAHSLLGYANLYLAGNVTLANNNFRDCIERGGEVAFIVLNDRKTIADKSFSIMESGSKLLGIFRKRGNNAPPSAASTPFNDSVKGSLFVSKNRVKFQADDNKNTFDVPASTIIKAEVNQVYGKERYAFHVTVKKDGDNEKQNYNFAMLSSQPNNVQQFTKDETNLAISLISSEKGRTTKNN